MLQLLMITYTSPIRTDLFLLSSLYPMRDTESHSGNDVADLSAVLVSYMGRDGIDVRFSEKP